MNASRLFMLVACHFVSAAASAQTLTCSSDDMGRHLCRANTANGVQLVHQRSGSPCTMGVSWGYDSSGIWVDHGCRADFSLNGVGNGGGGGGFTSPQDAQRSCKNTAGERLPGVPLAYISVYLGSNTGDGNYMVNFRAQPPNNRPSSGFCIISKSGQLLRFQFDPNSGPNPGGGGGISPNDAMRSCKNTAGERLPQVPLAYISVYRGTDTGSGSYMINFRAQPPSSRVSSGFCIIAKNGQLQNFQFDPGSGPGGGYQGGGNSGKLSSQDAMRSCQNAVASRMPSVPLAYIHANKASAIGGGGYMVDYQAPNLNGFCNVYQGRPAEVWSGGRKLQ